MPQLLRRTAILTLLLAGLLLPAATSEAGPAKGVVRTSSVSKSLRKAPSTTCFTTCRPVPPCLATEP